MADDFDIEAMLEAPYKKDENKSSSANGREERSKKKKKSRSKSRSRSRDKKRSKSQDRKKSRERKTSKSHERKRSRSKERRRSRSRSKERGGRYRARRSPLEPIDNLTPEERDARTVFCMQLAARIRPRDLEEFFSAVGKARTSNCVVVRDVRMISDRNSRRSKGIAYIEFVEASSVPLAIGLTGQRLLGVPIIVQASQGNIYVKCPAISAAMAAVSGLHGRWFAGKMITAAYVPLATYHNLFPESVMATQLLMPIRR
ncbi:UNVERIFIED_CONTAM: hypothetical protein FKN15_000999 [Acipenser sinensis]